MDLTLHVSCQYGRNNSSSVKKSVTRLGLKTDFHVCRVRERGGQLSIYQDLMALTLDGSYSTNVPTVAETTFQKNRSGA